ncbi:hypothetical protein FH608_038430 [Nonomuraea phyllanthi]|uniref:Uncharacterized protein n=1 Tax=Nonomuraea phyllanthi TaxID=2219224 RepID=A0A5C4VQS5_9ACTN|nr:hypothetical protein [Nonomuraea phyllanthi]KAB8189873.1 hypothetical protein FH608_038430 [Nonomuraea phyllanthi]
MRTPPHLPARTRRDPRDTADTPRARRHPYGRHEVPVQAAPRGTRDLPDVVPADLHEPDVFVEQRLLGIREMSNQAIGSIDDLLQHTA